MKLSMLNANFFSSVLYIILAVLVLLFMVLIHELGHYTAGRMLGFKIDEFSVGFGKAIFSKKNKRGELISLRIFPLGGYCAFAGENEDGAVGDDSRAFNKQKPWKRMIVLFFGAFFNFLSAIIFSFILLVSFGYDIPQVTAIKENSINQNLQVGDIIYEVNGNKIDFAYSGTLNKLLSDFDDTQPITLKIKRDGKMQDCVVSLMKNPKENEADAQTYQLGIEVKAYRHSFGEALLRAVPFAVGLAFLVLKSLWMLITFQLPLSQLGGPITTISTIASMAQTNIANLFILVPLIAANLAMFNLLPFPALDGSHLVFTAIEGVRKKPINKKVENAIHTGGLIFLFAFVILVDIIHFFIR